MEDKIEEKLRKNVRKHWKTGKMKERSFQVLAHRRLRNLATPLYSDYKSVKSFQSEWSSDLFLSIFFQNGNGIYITHVKITFTFCEHLY